MALLPPQHFKGLPSHRPYKWTLTERTSHLPGYPLRSNRHKLGGEVALLLRKEPRHDLVHTGKPTDITYHNVRDRDKEPALRDRDSYPIDLVSTPCFTDDRNYRMATDGRVY